MGKCFDQDCRKQDTDGSNVLICAAWEIKTEKNKEGAAKHLYLYVLQHPLLHLSWYTVCCF